jgi:hypothetical protein
MNMRPVYIECQSVESMQPQGSAGTRSIAVELSMTDAQVRAAVLELIGGMPEQDAYEWFRNEMPSWFKVEA